MAASCAVSSAGDAATSSWKRGTRSKSTSRHPWKGWRYGVSCGPASATIDASAVSWAIVDIANFYVSAERLFDPALRDVPVIVLSNNDGCAIARSEEAKALHVRMGDPVFKMRDRIKRHGIQLRSSNYELYADLNRRFNAVIADHSDMVEIRSEEHTSELQSLMRISYADFCLKKKKIKKY